MVAMRIKVAYIRLLEEGEEALIPKEVVDESPEEDPFARAWNDEARFSDDRFRLRTTVEGGC